MHSKKISWTKIDLRKSNLMQVENSNLSFLLNFEFFTCVKWVWKLNEFENHWVFTKVILMSFFYHWVLSWVFNPVNFPIIWEEKLNRVGKIWLLNNPTVLEKNPQKKWKFELKYDHLWHLNGMKIWAVWLETVPVLQNLWSNKL